MHCDNNWFEIWYQPKIDLKRKCLAGAEALARIHHPQLGILLPGSFLPDVDEDSIAELAQHALLATLCDWTMFDEAGFNLHLAINVPVGVLLRMPLAALVEEYRPKSEHWPGLILEVTEDQIVRDIALANEIAAQLRGSGISIAIDDFGAGYSSFSSLRNLPFAELKIDRSFVRDCATDATNAAICQTAIDLAHRFGSAAVAEGIESQADLQALMVMGCDFGQGVLIAPPMPKDRFLDLLRQRMNKPRAEPPRLRNPPRDRSAGWRKRPALRLLESGLDPFRQRRLERVEDHRHHGVIAEDADQFDRAGVAQDFLHAVEDRRADALLGVKLLEESVDRHLVFRRGFRRPAGLQRANGLRLHAGLLAEHRMRRPFILRLPVRGGAKRREFQEPRRHAGFEPQMAAELLRQFAESRRVQKDRERPGKLELAARAGFYGFRQRPLARR